MDGHPAAAARRQGPHARAERFASLRGRPPKEWSREDLKDCLRRSRGGITPLARSTGVLYRLVYARLQEHDLIGFARSLRPRVLGRPPKQAGQPPASASASGGGRALGSHSYEDVLARLTRLGGAGKRLAEELACPYPRVREWIRSNGLEQEALRLRQERSRAKDHEAMLELVVRHDGDLSAVGRELGGGYHKAYWVVRSRGLMDLARELRVQRRAARPIERLTALASSDPDAARAELRPLLAQHQGSIHRVASALATWDDRIASLLHETGLHGEAASLREQVMRCGQDERAEQHRGVLLGALALCGGNRVAASRMLGWALTTTFDRMKRFGIPLDRSWLTLRKEERAERRGQRRERLCVLYAQHRGCVASIAAALGVSKESIRNQLRCFGIAYSANAPGPAAAVTPVRDQARHGGKEKPFSTAATYSAAK